MRQKWTNFKDKQDAYLRLRKDYLTYLFNNKSGTKAKKDVTKIEVYRGFVEIGLFVAKDKKLYAEYLKRKSQSLLNDNKKQKGRNKKQ